MRRLAEEVVRIHMATSMDLSNNSLHDAACEYVADILDSGAVKLETLDLSTNHISGSGVATMQEQLEFHNSLRVLVLKHNVLGDAGARVLAAVLLKNKHLLELQLDSNGITDKGTAAIASALKLNATLRRVDLGYNLIGDPGYAAVVEMIHVNTALTELWMLGMQASSKAVQQLASSVQSNITLAKFAFSVKDAEGLKAVKKSHAVRRSIAAVARGEGTLSMRQFELGDAAVEKLTQVISKNDGLKEVILEGCVLPPKGLDRIAAALKAKQTLKTVSLSGTQVSDEAAETLAEVFESNASLSTVDLGNCGMSETSTERVASFVQNASALSKVNMVGNSLNDVAAERIADGIKHCGSLREIRMQGGGGLTEEGVKKIAAAVEAAPEQVERLGITHVDVSDEVADGLCRSIKKSANLAVLDLSHCAMGPKAGGAIADALSKNQTVQKVALAGNHFGNAGGEKLVAALATHTGLVELNIEKCDMQADTVMKVVDQVAGNGRVKKVALGGNKLTAKDQKALKERMQATMSKSKAQASVLVHEDKELAEVDRMFDDDKPKPLTSARGAKKKHGEHGEPGAAKGEPGSAPSSARQSCPNSARQALTPRGSPRDDPGNSNVQPAAMDYDTVPESFEMPNDGDESDPNPDPGVVLFESEDSANENAAPPGVLLSLHPDDVPDEPPLPDDGDSDGEPKPSTHHIKQHGAGRGDVKVIQPKSSPRTGSSPRGPIIELLEYGDVPDILVVKAETWQADGIGWQDLDDVTLAETMEMPFEEVPDELPILDEGDVSDGENHVTIRV